MTCCRATPTDEGSECEVEDGLFFKPGGIGISSCKTPISGGRAHGLVSTVLGEKIEIKRIESPERPIQSNSKRCSD